jgi:hypothetical protein
MTDEKSPANGDVTNLEDSDLENVAGGTSEIKSVNGGQYSVNGGATVTFNIQSPGEQRIDSNQQC